MPGIAKRARRRPKALVSRRSGRGGGSALHGKLGEFDFGTKFDFVQNFPKPAVAGAGTFVVHQPQEILEAVPGDKTGQQADAYFIEALEHCLSARPGVGALGGRVGDFLDGQ